MKVLAIFGPTAVGKTGIAIEVANALREGGEDPVAVNCDSIQIYRGLEVLSGAATEEERERLEHRLLGFVDPAEEFSAGRYAEMAHAEVDSLLGEGRRPIVVGGTGLYLRAALSQLELRPPVPPSLRAAVEREIATEGPRALHDQLDPEVAATVHPNDVKRIARLVELQRAGIKAPGDAAQLWTQATRHPTVLVGVTMGRDELEIRVSRRVDAMAAAGAADQARAVAAHASRTARAAIGFDEFVAGDLEAVKAAHLRYARRQLTWMRKMAGEAAAAEIADVCRIDRSGREDADVATEVMSKLGTD